MANGGEVIFKFTGETKGLENAEKKANSVLAGVGKTALKTAGIISAAIGGALVGIVTQSVKARGAIEQSIGGVETLFKKNADEVIKNANRAYKTAGVDANKYMEQVTSFSASLLQGLKGDTKKAVTYADTAITDMADNANKFGTSMEMIQNAYQGFAKQNFTMLDNLKLGYGGTKTEMKRLIDDANKVKKANGQMANLSIESFADMVEAIHIIQEEMGVTGTTAKEAEKTLTGSVASMKASWQNFLSGSGNLAQVIETGKIAMDNLVRIVKESLPDIWNGIRDIAPYYIKELMDELKPVIKNTIEFLKDVFDWGKRAFVNIAKFGVSALKGISTFVKRLNTDLKPLKVLITTIGSAIIGWKVATKIVTGLKLAMDGSRKATILYKTAVKAFNIVQTVFTGLMTAGKTIMAVFTGQTTLATVASNIFKTSMAKLNAVLLANPLGAVLASLGAFVGLIAGLSLAGVTDEMKRNHEETRKLTDEINNLTASYRDMSEQTDKTMTDTTLLYNGYQELSDRLKTMVDANGKIKEGYEEEARTILDRLAPALDLQYEITGNQIKNYQELQREIDNTIEKKRKEAIFEAAREQYIEDMKAQLRYQQDQNNLLEQHEKLLEDWDNSWGFARISIGNDLKAIDEALRKNADEEKKRSKRITNYERALIEDKKGNTKTAISLMQGEAEEIIKYTDLIGKSEKEQKDILDKQVKDYLERAKKYGENYKNNVTGYTAAGYKELVDLATKASKEADKVGKQIPENLAKNIKNDGTLKGAVTTVANTIKNTLSNNLTSGQMKSIGANANKGLANGLSVSYSYDEALRVAEKIKSAIKKALKIASPSKVFMEYGQYIDEGLVLGLRSKEDAIYGTMDRIASGLAFDTNDFFNLSPTLNNTATSSSNVTVQVYNNMETDLMGNLINNIKTYSNGSKNDYNYGMA